MTRNTKICMTTSILAFIALIVFAVSSQPSQEAISGTAIEFSSFAFHAIDSIISIITLPLAFILSFLTLLSFKTYGLSIIVSIILFTCVSRYSSELCKKREKEVLSSPHKRVFQSLRESDKYFAYNNQQYHKTDLYRKIGRITSKSSMLTTLILLLIVISILIDVAIGKTDSFSSLWAVVIPSSMFVEVFHLENLDFMDSGGVFIALINVFIFLLFLDLIDNIIVMKLGKPFIDINKTSPDEAIDKIIDDLGDRNDELKRDILLLREQK